MKESIKTIFGWLIVIGIIVVISFAFGGSEDKNSNTEIEKGGYPSYVSDDYISEHEEDVEEYKEKPDGSYTVEACSQNSGNCYDLDADISDGVVERIYFSNGGHLDLDGAELDEYGSASGDSFTVGEGYNSDTWEIQCDDCE